MAETSIEWTATQHPETAVWHGGFSFNPWQGCAMRVAAWWWARRAACRFGDRSRRDAA